MSDHSDPVHPIEHIPAEPGRNFKSAVRFSGHVVSIESPDSPTIPVGEKAFLSHLQEYFRKDPTPNFSASEAPIQYTTNDLLMAARPIDALLQSNQFTQVTLGLGSSGLTGTGVEGVLEGSESKRLAARAADPKKEREAELETVLGGTEVLTGATGTINKALAFTSAIKNVNAGVTGGSSLGQATFISSVIGGACSFFWFAFLGKSFWNSLENVWSVEAGVKRNGINAEEENKIAVGSLKKMMDPTIFDTIDGLRDKYRGEKGIEGIFSEDQASDFKGWVQNFLGNEAQNLAKDFLQTINPGDEERPNFDQMAEKLLRGMDSKERIKTKWESAFEALKWKYCKEKKIDKIIPGNEGDFTLWVEGVFTEEAKKDGNRDEVIKTLPLDSLRSEYCKATGIEWDPKEEPEFNDWLDEPVNQQAKDLAVKFLQDGNTEDILASRLLSNVVTEFQGSDPACSELEMLGLEPKHLIGLESLHRNRIELGQKNLMLAIGSEAFDLLKEYMVKQNPTEEETEALLKAVDEGILAAKTVNMLGVIFGALGSAVTAAGVVSACVFCPPFGFVVACAVFTVGVAAIGAYIDINTLIKTLHEPGGKYDERMNGVKIAIAIGAIAVIVALSGASLGTVPAAISLAVILTVVILSITRAVLLRQRALEEERAKMDEASLKGRCSKITDPKEKRTIEKIIRRKMTRSQLNAESKERFAKKIFTAVSSEDVQLLEEQIQAWADLEKQTIANLKEVFDDLKKDLEPALPLSWEEYLRQFFEGTPHLDRAF